MQEGDTIPLPASSGSGPIPVASVTGHSYQCQKHSGLSRRNQPITTKWSLHPDMTTRILELWGFLTCCHSPQRTAPAVRGSDFGAASTDSGCTITTSAGTVGVHVSSISLAGQSHSETLISSSWRHHTDGLLVAISAVVSTSDTFNCLWSSLGLYRTAQICCFSQGTSWTGSRTICIHGGSHAALPDSRIFRRGH